MHLYVINHSHNNELKKKKKNFHERQARQLQLQSRTLVMYDVHGANRTLKRLFDIQRRSFLILH